jgi:NADH-ubiquinone oxidoreductase chain 1
LAPIFIIFFIGAIAETNRAPFDLAEAESELVSGFMTEHSAVIFVFFFLAEYASIVFICILISILFLGGYIINIMPIVYILYIIDIVTILISNMIYYIITFVVQDHSSFIDTDNLYFNINNLNFNMFIENTFSN